MQLYNYSLSFRGENIIMDLQISKKIIYESLKGEGFIPISNKRLLVEDRGFYLIVVESVPLRKVGFLLDIGVKFLWSTYYGISYDYSAGNDTRINVQSNPLGAILFESNTIDTDIRQLLTDARKKIVEYRELSSFDVLKTKIEAQNDFEKSIHSDYEEIDVSLAVVKMFSGEHAAAKKILLAAAKYNEVAVSLLEHFDNIESFRSELISIINNCRKMMSCTRKLPLPPVSLLWSD